MTPPGNLRTRRQVLRRSSFVLTGVSLAGWTSSNESKERPTTATATETGTENSPTAENRRVSSRRTSLGKLGQTQLSSRPPPSGGYSGVAIRPDGRYAVVGTKWGTDGTYLVDLADPAAPQQVHYLPQSNGAPNIDVKVDHRNGLYYRTIEYIDVPSNFQVVDYGYASATPTNPEIIATVEGGKSHNVQPHPKAPVLYAANYYQEETNGFDIYDVTDPTAPRKLGEYGPRGLAHDITVDPARKVLCCMYQGGPFVGYVVYDVSDPRAPVEVGRFDYAGRQSYDHARVGEEAFGSAHHGHFDPRRELLVVGDERPYGIPGGKHVFDIGWQRGSLANPLPIGFTVSPNARRMEEGDRTQRFDWTGHHFSIVPRGDTTLLVSADWHEGIVVYDITDPTAPQPIEQYPTTDGMQTVRPNDAVAALGTPPMAWKAAYNPTRELVVASDSFTGLYTFELTPRRR